MAQLGERGRLRGVIGFPQITNETPLRARLSGEFLRKRCICTPANKIAAQKNLTQEQLAEQLQALSPKKQEQVERMLACLLEIL